MAKNNTNPLNVIQMPHPARVFQTNLVPEAALQNFGPCRFVMPQADGSFIEYDGTTDPGTVDVRFNTAPPHNYAAFIEGRNLLEVLEKDADREIEISLYKGGVALTAADLVVGKVYGVTKITQSALASAPYKGGEGLPTSVWYLDATKTAATVAFCRITAVNLRGFGPFGAFKDNNTGGVEDLTARVLGRLVK